ncbi:hypothetical protein CW368_07775 [Actinomycetales bacterium SN12]|nr:hypothetical protein CW368_07775 [Actinomycetales bacterium SN12]
MIPQPGGSREEGSMSQDYEIDTDVLRTMATKARGAVDSLGSSEVTQPKDPGHEWVTSAAAGFSASWSEGLTDRVTDTEDFADRLDTTARVFDEGTDAAKAEIDAMIWED